MPVFARQVCTSLAACGPLPLGLWLFFWAVVFWVHGLLVAAEELDRFPPVRPYPFPNMSEGAFPHHPHLAVQEGEELP